MKNILFLLVGLALGQRGQADTGCVKFAFDDFDKVLKTPTYFQKDTMCTIDPGDTICLAASNGAKIVSLTVNGGVVVLQDFLTVQSLSFLGKGILVVAKGAHIQFPGGVIGGQLLSFGNFSFGADVTVQSQGILYLDHGTEMSGNFLEVASGGNLILGDSATLDIDEYRNWQPSSTCFGVHVMMNVRKLNIIGQAIEVSVGAACIHVTGAVNQQAAWSTALTNSTYLHVCLAPGVPVGVGTDWGAAMVTNDCNDCFPTPFPLDEFSIVTVAIGNDVVVEWRGAKKVEKSPDTKSWQLISTLSSGRQRCTGISGTMYFRIITKREQQKIVVVKVTTQQAMLYNNLGQFIRLISHYENVPSNGIYFVCDPKNGNSVKVFEP